MSKTTNLNTIKKKSISSPRDKETLKNSWIETYRDLITFRIQPVPQAVIDRIAQELTEWSLKPDSLRLQDFYWDKNICDDTYYEWVNKYPSLNFYHRKAKNLIASRREKGMLSKDMPETAVLKSLYKYDTLYAEIREDDKQDKIEVAIAVKAAQDNAQGNITVVMESFSKETESC